jgi:methyl-accepting chemotaxis protein
MRERRRISLRWQLVLVAVITAAMAQVLAGGALTFYDNKVYKDRKTQETVVEAEILAAGIAPALEFNDAQATQKYLDPLTANAEVAAAGAYASDGALVASYSGAGPEHRQLPRTAPPNGQHFDGDNLLVSVPAGQAQEKVGSVYLIVTAEPILTRLARYAGVVFLALLGSLAFAMLLSMRLVAAIADPIRDIAEGASRITAGDLSVTVPPTNRTDEIGVLVETFDQMVSGLRQMSSEMRSSAGMLGEMASTVLTTTTQVSAGAAETATAIGETSVTMEELKQTVQMSAEKARQVSEGAQRTAQVTMTGREAVEAVTHGMTRIREQVEGVAESIMRLSERSQAIGEIIAAVNDLADQSNLLAVNAAIEAARAGEHGRGFSVVAQEVKNLAEQSKHATAQVRTILGEIQKATGGAVLATEQCTKAVDLGVQRSAQAGESIRILAENIENATHAAMQIAASSQQQLVGVSQVALAMENIKEASTQNATVVRQTEAAARSMTELSLKLGALVERYRG